MDFKIFQFFEIPVKLYDICTASKMILRLSMVLAAIEPVALRGGKA